MVLSPVIASHGTARTVESLRSVSYKDLPRKTVDEAIELAGGFGRVQACAACCMIFLNGVTSIYVLQLTLTIKELESALYGVAQPLISASGSAFFAAWGLSTGVFGVLVDKYGRRSLIALSSCCCMAASMAQVVVDPLCQHSEVTHNSTCVSGLWWLYFCQIFLGVAISGTWYSYVLAMEWLPAERRCSVNVWWNVVFSLWGASAAGLLAALPNISWDWHVLSWQVAMGICTFTFLLYVDEAPRFLVVVGKEQQALRVLHRIAKANGVDFPSIVLERPPGLLADSGESANIIQYFRLIRRSSLLLQMMTLSLCWFTVTVSYYGMAFSAGNLSKNVWVNSALLSLSDIPGWFMARLADRPSIGRCRTQMVSLILGSVFLIAVTILGPESDATLFLSMAGKLFIATAFSNIYLFSAEVFPTEIRATSMSICNVTARIGGLMAPLLINAKFTVTMGVFAVLCLVSGVLCTFLRETRGIGAHDSVTQSIASSVLHSPLTF